MNVRLQEESVLLDRFVLQRPLQDDLAASLWFARDLRLDVGVLLRIHRAAPTGGLRDELARDLQSYGGLDHTHVARIHDVHETDEFIVVSMSPHGGELLSTVTRDGGPLPFRQIVDRIRPLVEGLVALQDNGVEHGRVAPDHVLATQSNWCLLPGDRTRPVRNDLLGIGHVVAAALTGDRPPEGGRSVNDVADRLHAGRTIPALLNQLVDDLRTDDATRRPAGMHDVLHRLDQLDRFLSPEPRDETPQPQPARVATSPPARHARRRPWSGRLAWLLVPVALVAGLVLLQRIGARSQAPTPDPDTASTDAVSDPTAIDGPGDRPGVDPATPAMDPAVLAEQRAGAESALDRLLAVRRQAEEIGASVWGDEVYRRAVETAAEADRAYLEERYDDTIRGYDEAAGDFLHLVDTKSETLTRLLDEGRTALETPDAEHAISAFSGALLIDPDHEEAAIGLERAGTLEELHRLLASGREHEAAERLDFAHADFAAAAGLDPRSVEAAAAYEAIKDRIADAEFRAMMARGMDAFHQGDLESARAGLLEAQRFRPDSEEVSRALDMVEEGQRRREIERLRSLAATHEDDEAWQKAWNVYRQLLAIDSAILFAQDGRTRCEEMIRLRQELDHYLDHPELLTRRGTREDSVRLVTTLEQRSDLGPVMRSDRTRLAELVELANTPVSVELRSDDLTEVSVHRVGRLGTMRSRAVDVLPGVHTVVGRRKGYKDVRLTLEVAPGADGVSLDVVCTERIDG